jgi:hypothetical protein
VEMRKAAVRGPMRRGEAVLVSSALHCRSDAAIRKYRSVVIPQNWPLSGVCVWLRYAGLKKERATAAHCLAAAVISSDACCFLSNSLAATDAPVQVKFSATVGTTL